MKTKVLLPLSLALNLLLAGKVFLGSRIEVSSTSHTPGAAQRVEAGEQSNQPSVPATPTMASNLLWGAIESTNYYTYVENLRAIGCPELTIREILSADLSASLRHGEGEKGSISGGRAGADAAYRDALVNHFMNPSDVSAPSRDPVAASGGLAAQGDATSLGSEDGSLNGGGNRADPGEAERKRKRTEALQRMWFVDAVRARYGIETLLEWQFQSVKEGISFEDYVRRHTEPIPR